MGNARSVFTRLLPWAALALMTVMFFVQVKARQKAEGDAARRVIPARDVDSGLEVVALDGPADPKKLEAFLNAAFELELADLRKQLEAAHEKLAAAKSAHEALLAKAERTEALRVTESARATALDVQLAADTAAAEKRVAALEAELKAAQTLLERRKSPVAVWFDAWKDADEAARAALRKKIAKATPDDVAELAALWNKEESGGRLTVFLGLLGAMPVTKESAALAAEIASCEPGTDADALRSWVALAGNQLLHVDTFLALQAEPHLSMRHVLVEHAEASPKAWSDEDRARVAPAFTSHLGAQDAGMVRFALNAITRLDLPVVSARVLPLLDHADATVRIAAIYFLLQGEGGAPAAKVLGRYVVRLLDDKEADVRMAGLFLAQELAGEKRSLAFGSSEQAVTDEITRLKKKLAALAKD